MLPRLLVLVPVLALVACGPTKRDGEGDDGSGSNTPDAGHLINGDGMVCTGGAEICDDGIDNDCDGLVDCADPDCSGVGSCPVCGMVNDPEATPIDLPDGVSDGKTCSTDADCTSASAPNCIIAEHAQGGPIKECHASYTSTLNFIGFPEGATLTDTTKLLSVCLDIEHSYLHDLQIEVLSPPAANGTRAKVTVHEFQGRIGPEIFVGIPYEDDESGPVHPGTAWHYCFVPTAASTIYGNDEGAHLPAAPIAPDTTPSEDGEALQVPAGNYQPMEPFSELQGAPLNGTWTMRVTDMFAIDNGTLDGWSITFDPSLVTSCTGPIIN